MELDIIEQELVPKGKVYLVLREGPPEGLAEICRNLRAKGAQNIFLSYKGHGEDPPAADSEGLRLIHAHDMLGLICALTPRRSDPDGRLTLEPLTREQKDLFLGIYNHSFFAVPNSATYGDKEFEQLMGSEYRCGFALLRGEPVGIYELGFKKEHPEIGSIGLVDTAMGQGLGRTLLLTVMELLGELGCTKCWLQVSTGNQRALALYRSVGFGADELLSRWYEVTES